MSFTNIKLIYCRELRDQMQTSPLCDEAGFVERVEEVYRLVWTRWVGHP